MVRAAHSMVVVARIARREVQNLTPGAGKVLAAPLTRRLDGRRRAGCCLEHAVDGFGEGIAGETPGREDELAVGVEVDEAADAVWSSGGEFGGEAVDGAVLGRVAWSEAAVGLPAWVGG